MVNISFKNITGIKPDKLSAVIGADSFFYGLFTEDHKLLEVNHYTISDFSNEEIIEKIKFDLVTTQGYDINVASTCKPYMHIPKSDGGKLTRYFPSFHNKSISGDLLTDQEVSVDYGLRKDQHKFLDDIFGLEYDLFHFSTVLSNFYYPYTTPKVVAFIDRDILHIMYAHDQKFVYYNQFSCVDKADYLYFISLVYKELGIDKDVPLEISGRIDVSSPIYTLLYDYYKKIDFMRSSTLSIKDLRFTAMQHYYLDLFATMLCV